VNSTNDETGERRPGQKEDEMNNIWGGLGNFSRPGNKAKDRRKKNRFLPLRGKSRQKLRKKKQENIKSRPDPK